MEIQETPLVVTHEAPPQPTAAPDLSEAAVRAAVQAEDAANAAAGLKEGTPQPITTAEKPVDVPEKFVKADGTVDVEKIQASTKQLDEAIQQKQEALKTIEDYMAEYREKEKQFRNLPNPNKVAAQVTNQVREQVPAIDSPPDLQALEKQIAEDYQRDPIKTMIDLQRAIVKKELEPIVEWRQRDEQERREMGMKQSLAELANREPTILKPEVFNEVVKELRDDPHYWNLKNPYKAAWNEVKERLGIGGPSPAPAQPTKPVAPILGGGTPPPVPSQVRTEPSFADLAGAIQSAKTPQESANLEAALRSFLQRMDQGR